VADHSPIEQWALIKINVRLPTFVADGWQSEEGAKDEFSIMPSRMCLLSILRLGRVALYFGVWSEVSGKIQT
jgi:hypothetical protein